MKSHGGPRTIENNRTKEKGVVLMTSAPPQPKKIEGGKFVVQKFVVQKFEEEKFEVEKCAEEKWS